MQDVNISPSVWSEAQWSVLRVIHYADHVGMTDKYAIIRRLELEEGIFIDSEAEFYNLVMLLVMGDMLQAKPFRLYAKFGNAYRRVWAYALTDKAKAALWLRDYDTVTLPVFERAREKRP